MCQQVSTTMTLLVLALCFFQILTLSNLRLFFFVPITHNAYLAMSDEERGYYEAQDQWSQYHGVTELEEPHAQQAAHLNEVQRSHLEKHTNNVKKKRVSVDLTAWSKSGPMKEDRRLCVWLK